MENDKGAAKDAAALLLTEKIKDYYDNKYVKLSEDGTLLEYLEEELSDENALAVQGYKVVVENGEISLIRISDNKKFVAGTIDENGKLAWIDTNDDGEEGMDYIIVLLIKNAIIHN